MPTFTSSLVHLAAVGILLAGAAPASAVAAALAGSHQSPADRAGSDDAAEETKKPGAETTPKGAGGTGGTGAPASKPHDAGSDKNAAELREAWKRRSIHELTPKDLDGKPAPLATYDGKVLLIVNVASRCGLTPQYTGLEALQKEYKDRGLVVLGFPCNDFNNQEPGTPAEIRDFCTTKYAVTFPLFEKVSVKPGEEQAELYTALQAKTGATPRWNFGKYLVTRDGVTATFFDSRMAPDAPELREAIEKALAEAAPATRASPAAGAKAGTVESAGEHASKGRARNPAE
ncbi:MAG TPA: glutathione peroxidase [Phycisphaerales bacterium]|nr:glutathione peroxidase [Phycisphaerales bacterium]HMP37435.1 glutathione peroxidase [Phycisphaerales bacterium]